MINKPLKWPNLRYLTISQKLPLLICALILCVVLVFGFISYIGVRKAALKVGEERLQTLSQQLGGMLSNNTRSMIASVHAYANQPSIKSFLLSNEKDSSEAEKILDGLRKDSAYVQSEIRNVRGKRVLGYYPEEEININLDSVLRSTISSKIDSGRIGRMYLINDSVFYPIVATISHNKQLIGYMVRWRKVAARGVDQIARLMGRNAKFYVGNADASVWTDLEKPVPAGPLGNQSDSQLVEYERSNSTVLASMRPIRNSQWLVSVEFPKKNVLHAANSFLYWLVLAGSILLTLGIVAAWLMSYNITQPLKNLTGAATQITTGNFSTPIEMNRFDELGKLGRAFNAMSRQVQDSQLKLQAKAENYRMLFEHNPMPMWIIARSSLNILHVNQAAVREYGYSREEFLRLNAKDLRPEEDIDKYESFIQSKPENNSAGIWRHRKKDGTIIMVDVIADSIMFEGHEARIILANDVTEKLKMERELLNHRIKQQEIITEAALQAQEKEREELGKELHDNINQILASAKLYLDLARTGNTDLLDQAISKSYENVNLAIGEIRQLSKHLVPPMLDDRLINILKEMTEEIQAATAISVELNAAGFSERSLTEDAKLMMYRIVQEQMTNVIKHAKATHVTINLSSSEDAISLMIADNGVGFDTSQKSKGIGLRNIDNRVKFYKGNAVITSRKGQGCTLEVHIPMNRKPELAAG